MAHAELIAAVALLFSLRLFLAMYSQTCLAFGLLIWNDFFFPKYIFMLVRFFFLESC